MWIGDIIEAFKEIGEEKGIFSIDCIDKSENNYIYFTSGRIYGIMEHQFIDRWKQMPYRWKVWLTNNKISWTDYITALNKYYALQKIKHQYNFLPKVWITHIEIIRKVD